MHFHNKSAAAAPLDHTFLYCADQQLFELSCDDIIDEANMNAHLEDLLSNDSEVLAAGSIRAPIAAFGFYNLVKACAKDDPALGARNLAAHVADTRRDINGKNAKGSTGLHACGYLRRWDLAQVLLNAGADPSCKNVAGHSFFLTAVRDPGAPWERLLERHPELHERHRSFLSKGSGTSRSGTSRRGDRSEAKQQGLIKAGVGPVLEVVREKERSAVVIEPSLIAALDADEWNAVATLLARSPANLVGYTLPADRLLNMACNAPQRVLELLHAAALPFTQDSSLKIACRALADGWTGAWWIKLGRSLSLSNQEELLNAALRDKRIDLILPMAQEGWCFGEDFIESCEESGYLDLADHLIDLSASFKGSASAGSQVTAGTPMGSTRKKRSSGDRSMPPPKKGNSKGGKGAKRVRPVEGGTRQSKQGSARRSAMIANLDGPVREANEFEYKDKKPATSTTIIIVKKARLISLSET